MRTRRYLQILIISFTVDVLTSPGASGSNPQQHPQKLEVFNGSGSGEYRDGENVNLVATVKEGYEFVRWYAVAGSGTLKNEEKGDATYIMGDDPAEVVAVFAKVSSWFPPAEEEEDEKVGLLLTKPQAGTPMRLEQKIKVKIDRGKNPKPKLREIWDKLRLRLEWKDTSLAQYYTLEKGGDAMESGSRNGIPKDKFEEKGEAYEGSIWYEGGLDSDEMAARDSPPEVETVVKLVIGGTLGKISAEGKLAALYLGVDANRDGEVALGSSEDKTTPKNPYTFWVNNDFDRSDEDKLSGTPDWKDGTIQCIRDLEDFARLKMSVKGQRKAILDGKLKLGLEWKDATDSPAVQIYPHIEKAGGDDYLKEVDTAQKQISSGSSAIKAKDGAMTIEKGQAKIFPTLQESDASRDFENDGMLHLLFEGSGEGKGRLSVVIFDEKEKKLGEGVGVWLDIADVRKMYESSRDNMFAGTPADEARQTVVFVHGWNMSPEGSRNYAETMFKRLWHRGFKGRFAHFRWNTDWGGIPYHYNRGEYEAWKNGASLKSFVESLPYQTKNIAAHSMGNVVVGSALKSGLRIANYAMMQAAIPVGCYDADASANNYAPFIAAEAIKPTPDHNSDLGYRGYLIGTLGNVSGTVANFYNVDDFALVTGSYPIVGDTNWEKNQKTYKPDANAFLYNNKVYAYDAGPPNNPYAIGRRCFLRSTLLPFSERLVTDIHESLAFVARPRSKAVGAAANVGRSKPINVGEGSPSNFGRTQDDHSGQFMRSIQKTLPFYEEFYKVIK